MRRDIRFSLAQRDVRGAASTSVAPHGEAFRRRTGRPRRAAVARAGRRRLGGKRGAHRSGGAAARAARRSHWAAAASALSEATMSRPAATAVRWRGRRGKVAKREGHGCFRTAARRRRALERRRQPRQRHRRKHRQRWESGRAARVNRRHASSDVLLRLRAGLSRSRVRSTEPAHLPCREHNSRRP